VRLRILGAHQAEARDCRFVALLLDEVLAIDAGSLASALTLAEQARLAYVLLTHQHLDHVRDLPVVAFNRLSLGAGPLVVVASPAVQAVIRATLMDPRIWLDLFADQPDRPAPLRFQPAVPGQTLSLGPYTVRPVALATHPVPVLGYQVTGPAGRSLFYTGDTGPGCAAIWPLVRPDVLVIEVTFADSAVDLARQAGHLTPTLLRQELIQFRAVHGYLPQVVVLHTNPAHRPAIIQELRAVAADLGVSLVVAHEDLTLPLD